MSYRLIDPDETLDYAVDWSDWLDTGIVISTTTWSITPTGPTLSGQSDGSTSSRIYVSGCTLGVVYRLSCKITTSAATAQVAERTVVLRCEQR